MFPAATAWTPDAWSMPVTIVVTVVFPLRQREDRVSDGDTGADDHLPAIGNQGRQLLVGPDLDQFDAFAPGRRNHRIRAGLAGHTVVDGHRVDPVSPEGPGHGQP